MTRGHQELDEALDLVSAEAEVGHAPLALSVRIFLRRRITQPRFERGAIPRAVRVVETEDAAGECGAAGEVREVGRRAGNLVGRGVDVVVDAAQQMASGADVAEGHDACRGLGAVGQGDLRIRDRGACRRLRLGLGDLFLLVQPGLVGCRPVRRAFVGRSPIA